MSPISKIPKHLHPYIARQEYSLYSAIDHASWRYIMILSKSFFAKNAHAVYLSGLEKTGIETERIPLIDEMDTKLSRFGWRAVPIVGFIPPAIFMEFLSLGILPIACDMRKIENLDYTPAPDIVHEAAGHAPILADPVFARYLLSYGEIARKVIYTDRDEALYEAIRNLSDIKENPAAKADDIERAQRKMEEAYANLNEVSESTALARMGWWTFEYGLIGDINAPKIYGAGLLSSVGESFSCLRRDVENPVRFIPFSIDCIEQTYDITKPQPQLFVTPDFETLESELQKLGDRMAFRRGGVDGLQKAQRAKTVTTVEYESGIQISGILSDILFGHAREIVYLKFSGPCQLSYRGVEIESQGPEQHPQGFGAPVGLIAGIRKSLSDFDEHDMQACGIGVGKTSKIEFINGVIVEGRCVSKTVRDEKVLLISFDHCTVKYEDAILFDPSWGTFDLACGSRVTSVFGGAADRGSFLEKTTGLKSQYKTSQTSNVTDENKELVALYENVREVRKELRSGGLERDAALSQLTEITHVLQQKYPTDWLLRFELLELDLTFTLKAPWMKQVLSELAIISKESKSKTDLITRGLTILRDQKMGDA